MNADKWSHLIVFFGLRWTKVLVFVEMSNKSVLIHGRPSGNREWQKGRNANGLQEGSWQKVSYLFLCACSIK